MTQIRSSRCIQTTPAELCRLCWQVRIQRGGGGRGSGPPGKSQVIWVSIGNKHLDPPGKCWTPSRTLKFEIDHLTSVK